MHHTSTFAVFCFEERMSKYQDLTGQRFGRLTVIERTKNHGKQTVWVCKCDCGNFSNVQASNLKHNNVRSCGCILREMKPALIHGQHGTRLYEIWHSMKQRCYLPTVRPYSNYGGRGITVCDEWLHDFQAFYDWAMANGYRDDLTIDRKDTNGNYEPSNCRWATKKEQSNNKRNNRYITYNGETHTLAEWCEITGLSRPTLKYRLKYWEIERVFTEPQKLKKGTNKNG